MSAATVLSALLVAIGVAIVARTLAAGIDGAATGLILGPLFVAAGAGRLYLERRGR